jgi:hypothetical protein
MSESVTLPQDPPTVSASDAAPAVPLLLPSVSGAAEHSVASTPMPALPPAFLPEAHPLLELITRGLAPEADDATRGVARDLWAHFAHTIATTAPVTPAALVMPAAPVTPAAPVMPAAPVTPTAPVMPTMQLPTSPVAQAARMLRQLPPDQLLDLALQRLRAALPAGVTVPNPKGIQFQLVPVTPPPGAR